ncbi:MAG: hypothetical protein IKU46_10895 [Peptococcaceae bacterium]|nr:hypothetical protein [Peptococcaceae bacterium]
MMKNERETFVETATATHISHLADGTTVEEVEEIPDCFLCKKNDFYFGV